MTRSANKQLSDSSTLDSTETTLEKLDSVLAFDYGTQRIGVAAGNRQVGTAQGIDVVIVRDGTPDMDKINNLVDAWKPDCFVVGVPFTESKNSTSLVKEIREFVKLLEQLYTCPVFETNERLSSEESSNRISALERRVSNKKKSDLRNMIAAEIILETFLSSTGKLNHLS